MSISCGVTASSAGARHTLMVWVTLCCASATGAQPPRAETPEQSTKGAAGTGSEASGDALAEGLEDEMVVPPPPVPPEGLLPVSELVRYDFSPRDRPKPLLYGHRLVIVTESGIVKGHDADTGEFMWELGLVGEQLFDPVVFQGAPIIKDETPEFTVVLSTPAGHVAILDGPTGQIRQEAWLPFELALPPVKGPEDTVFLATPSGDIVSYDVADENILFRTTTGERPAAIASTESFLIVSGASQTLTALTLPKGDVLWTLTGRAGFFAAATFDAVGERLYVGDDTGELYSVDARSGDIKFRWSTGASIRSPVLVEDDRVFVATFANWLFAFRAGNGHELWRANLPGRPSTAPIRIGSRLMVATFDGILIELQPERGQLGKSYQAPGEIIHAPSFFIAQPDPEELLALEALGESAEGDDDADAADSEDPLDPDIFGPAELVSLDEPLVAPEPLDGEDGATVPTDGDSESAPPLEPREPAWFERSRVALALRNGQVLLLRHQVPTATPEAPEDGAVAPDANGEPATTSPTSRRPNTPPAR